MLRLSRILLVSLLSAVVVLSACTGRSARSAATSAPSPARTPTPTQAKKSTPRPTPNPTPNPTTNPTMAQPAAAKTVWTYTKQRPMTRFEAVDGVLIGMTLRKKLLRITALDPKTGKMLWDRPASPGYNPPGVSPEVLVMGKNVVYLDPVSTKYHFWTLVVVAAARTGRILTATEAAYEVDGLPETCGTSICFDGYQDLAGIDSPEESWQMNPTTGHVRSVSGSSSIADDDWRQIGDGGLIELGSGKNRSIGRQVKGKVIWQRKWSDFYSSEFTPDSGWQWNYDAKNHIFTGEIGWHPADIAKRVEHYTTSSIMIGLDSRTGKLRWKKVGVTQWCTAVDLVTELPVSEDDYRCRFRSGLEDYRKSAKTWLKDVGVTVEHYDHVNDRVTWSVALDPYSVSDDYAEPMVRILDDDHLLGFQHKKVIAFDLRNGKTTVVPSKTVGWCAVDDDVAYEFSPYSGAGKDRLTATLFGPCGSDGKQTKITTMPPKSLSASIGGIRVVTGLHSVTALKPA